MSTIKAPSLTLGVEEEYQVIDPETRELRSYITEILEGDRVTFAEIKPELHQSILEMGTSVCETAGDVRNEIVRMRRKAMEVAARKGLKIAAAGTHPFSSWSTQEITPLERYITLTEDLQHIARQNLIFGMHVHVGIEDKEFLIDAYNQARYFMPHLLALSASSPFWQGEKTGIKSYRSVVWRAFPRAGTPRALGSWSEYENIVRSLVRCGSIEDGSKIWWEVRPHWKYGTLEFRNCDICTRVDEAVAIAGLYQAIVAKLWKLRRDNMSWRLYPTELLEENKWRAVRYGLDGSLVDLGTYEQKPARNLIRELVEWFVDDVVDELGSRREVNYALNILENGTSADRQLRAFDESGDLKDVVDQIVRETEEGVIEPLGEAANA